MARCRALVLALALSMPPGAVLADFDAGLEAYRRGDFATALREFEDLAQKGVVLAYTNLGYMHALGEGVEADLAEAARWFERAARAGDARAQMTLGVMHYHGEGVARDRVNAFAWLSLAGAAGRDEALVYLELVRDELQPDELDRADRLARALFREHGDPELKRMMEGGWLARRAATPAR